MQISRRNALMGAGAAAAMAGVPGAVQGDDAVLLAQVAQFHELYNEWQRIWAKQKRHRQSVEDMPDCPEVDGTREGNQAHSDFMEAHDAFRYCDESERLGNSVGALANAIFETPPPGMAGRSRKVQDRSPCRWQLSRRRR